MHAVDASDASGYDATTSGVSHFSCRASDAVMVLLEMSVTPMGAGESVSGPVSACVALIDQSGLAYELHAMGTIVEGPLDKVLALLQSCVELLARDHDRVTCVAKLDYRRGGEGRLRGKVASVESKLGPKLGSKLGRPVGGSA